MRGTKLLSLPLACLLLCLSQSALAQPLTVSTPEFQTSLAPRSVSETQIITAYRRSEKSVVHISTQSTVIDVFGLSHQEGAGSGVIVDAKQGLIITNFHVIGKADRVIVTLADGSSYPVIRVGQDPDNEIALLQIVDPPKNLVAAVFSDSSKLEVGQRVLAIGNPFGLNRSLTTGIISSLGRTIRGDSGRLIEDIIQTDAAINPGNSGGPLLDMAGRVVGINTAIISRSGESAGIGFAIPSNQITKAIPQLIKYGKVLRPKIGVVFIDTDNGPALLYVQPGSPAERAGLQGARQVLRRGWQSGYIIDLSHADFVLAINGTEVRSKDEAISAIARTPSDREMEMVVRRGVRRGATRKVSLKPVLD